MFRRNSANDLWLVYGHLYVAIGGPYWVPRGTTKWEPDLLNQTQDLNQTQNLLSKILLSADTVRNLGEATQKSEVCCKAGTTFILPHSNDSVQVILNVIQTTMDFKPWDKSLLKAHSCSTTTAPYVHSNLHKDMVWPILSILAHSPDLNPNEYLGKGNWESDLNHTQ